MRVLLVAYYFEPYKGVGALRPTYWAKHMNKMDENMFCDVITAQSDIGNRVLPGGGKIITVLHDERSPISRFISIDAGVDWAISLKKHFKNLDRKYDVAIFTGGPFLHFFTAKSLKKKFGSRIVFDFRDPFANNPYHDLFYMKRLVKRFLEKKLLKIADVCVTVNEFCRDLLEESGNVRTAIIENGYNEETIDAVRSRTGHKGAGKSLVYAGKLYGASPEPFLKTVSSSEYINKVTFQYVGPDHGKVNMYNKGNIYSTDMLPYDKAVERIALSDTGIVLTGGQPFQSTTKIFDYIGLEKNIIVITEGKLYSGNIHEITKDYPYVYWAENNTVSIAKAINETLEIKHRHPFAKREEYSRKAGLARLLDILKSLN